MVNDSCKHVRVDNWGIFFLQRLQLFFSKTDYCDLTLQFDGNVQLKVHRLVINACTEYFQYLEQCQSLEENVILMPEDLQADVIVPIVNFMYTGTLQFQMALFDKLYRAAEIMNITVLTKLLDAQKATPAKLKKNPLAAPSKEVVVKKAIPQRPSSNAVDLPATLPGRKIPVWKRKSVPIGSAKPPLNLPSPPHQQFLFAEQRKCLQTVNDDPPFVYDNAPKPTRFEWPDDDDNLPSLSIMDTSFDEISYTSKPLMTVDYEMKVQPNFDDIRHNVKPTTNPAPKKHASTNLDMEDMKDYVKEQKIRSGFTTYDEDEYSESYDVKESFKRKAEAKSQEASPSSKKVKVTEKPQQVVHSKIITEILKKYPQLVKKNKNIRLKILAKNAKNTILDSKEYNKLMKNPKVKLEVTSVPKDDAAAGSTIAVTHKTVKENVKGGKKHVGGPEETAWTCEKCGQEGGGGGGAAVEFPLYYLYRKHMTDVHYEKFDPLLCKHCGLRCRTDPVLLHHQYVWHGVRPAGSHTFARCDLCPLVALDADALAVHRAGHAPAEKQCSQCTLTFANKALLGSHLQITGHGDKVTAAGGRRRFDCQYCSKKLASGVDLLAHLASEHRQEARSDGVVSVDDLDGSAAEEDPLMVKGEFVVPELHAEDPVKDNKVKILSNVKVDPNSQQRQQLEQQQQGQQGQQGQQVILEPSSEAEALSNVASGIATSLGLVDIVVLDDNQQYILQSSGQVGEQLVAQATQGGQPEYILPDDTAAAFAQSSAQHGQGVLPSGDIASTDELVMVLTDHDYKDGQSEITSDNSNIVVLYSHPVDGQQGQFITSQGLMVNSQGMLEIRNGATINTTASSSQLVVTSSHDTHIESIEMIQREIESQNQNNIKQEAQQQQQQQHGEAGTDTSVMLPPQQPDSQQPEAAVEQQLETQVVEHSEIDHEGNRVDHEIVEEERVDRRVPQENGDGAVSCNFQTQCPEGEMQQQPQPGGELPESYADITCVDTEIVNDVGKEESAGGQETEEVEAPGDQSEDTEQLTDNTNLIEEIDEDAIDSEKDATESKDESEQILTEEAQKEMEPTEGENGEQSELQPEKTDNVDTVDAAPTLADFPQPEPMEVDYDLAAHEVDDCKQDDMKQSESISNEEGAMDQACELEECISSEEKAPDLPAESANTTTGYDVPPDLIDRSPPTLEIEEPKTSDGFPNPDNEDPPDLEPAEPRFPEQTIAEKHVSEGQEEPMEVDAEMEEEHQATTDGPSTSSLDASVDEVDSNLPEQEAEDGVKDAEEEQTIVGGKVTEDKGEEEHKGDESRNEEEERQIEGEEHQNEAEERQNNGEERRNEEEVRQTEGDSSCDKLTENDQCQGEIETSEKEQEQPEVDEESVSETPGDSHQEEACQKSGGSPINSNDNSVVSQDSDEDDDGKKSQETEATKISILNDWDDTDSQQSSDRVTAIQAAGETVNKLMDEWEEEEEDENGKDYDN